MAGSTSRERSGARADGAPDAPPSPRSQPGATRLEGRFELGRELGRGSTGVVWEARDRLTEQTVAVKILRGEPFGARGRARRRRFRREVGSASALQHPHTVRVLAHGETADGHGFLVMEHLRGTTLGARLRAEGPFAQARAIRIAAQILDAVSAAHRLGIVHRDLKPGNVVLIERDGDPDFVKVCDFGLAKAIAPTMDDADAGAAADAAAAAGPVTGGHGPGTTGRWEICGTPEYMAPEQARGELIDGRADLYAVGAILFEAVVGRLPFVGRTPLDVVSQHLSAAPPRPTAVRPDLPIFPPLESLILRALSKDRAERPSSAMVFRADLLQIEQDLARAQRDDEAREPATGAAAMAGASREAATLPRRSPAFTVRQGGRSRRAVAAAVAAGGILISVSAGAIFGHRRPATAPAPVAVAVKTSIASAHASLSPEPLGAGRRADQEAAPSTPVPAARAPAPIRRRPPRTPASITAAVTATRTTPTSPSPSSVVTSSPADPLIESGDALLARGRIADACARGRDAVEATPEAPAAWEFLGRCYMRLGQPAQARTAYRRYLDVAPAGPHVRFVRAIVEQDGR